jgi:hypothetical protein
MLAQALSDQLHRLGAFCTSPLPLSESDKLTFDVLADQQDKIVAKLASWGWAPKPYNSGVRFRPEGNSVLPAPSMSFEIALPRTKPAVGTQKHGAHGELSDPVERAKRKLHGY